MQEIPEPIHMNKYHYSTLSIWTDKYFLFHQKMRKSITVHIQMEQTALMEVPHIMLKPLCVTSYTLYMHPLYELIDTILNWKKILCVPIKSLYTPMDPLWISLEQIRSKNKMFWVPMKPIHSIYFYWITSMLVHGGSVICPVKSFVDSFCDKKVVHTWIELL